MRLKAWNSDSLLANDFTQSVANLFLDSGDFK